MIHRNRPLRLQTQNTEKRIHYSQQLSLSATAFIRLVFLWHLPGIPGYKCPVTHLFSSKQIPNITQLLNFPFSTRVIKRLFRVLLFVSSSDVSQYTLSFLDVSLQQQISRRFWDISLKKMNKKPVFLQTTNIQTYVLSIKNGFSRQYSVFICSGSGSFSGASKDNFWKISVRKTI